MSRYFVPEKSWEKKKGLNKSIQLKQQNSQLEYKDEEDVFDPYHGPAPISNEVLKKYQRGKKLDIMSRYFVPEKSWEKKKGLKKSIQLKQQNSQLEYKDEEDVFDPYHGPAPISNEVLKKYQRGKKLDIRGIKTKSKRIELIKTDKKFRQSAKQAARNELLLPEQAGYLEPDDNEDTFRVKQTDLCNAVDITSASKIFSLSLTEFGPYKINYSRDGRHLLLGGRRGHIASFDWVTKQLLCEINVMESVHDLCWLHLPTMFAAAQKEWVYVYDNKGVELHCLKKLNRVMQIEFLPYHFLLVTSSEKGFLSWLDVSIGKMVKETYTTAGRLNIMCQNPYNAVVATGHANGSVSMWSPNVETPLVRMLCHVHPVSSMAIDSKGLYLATASVDRTLKIFDIRTYKCLQSYKLGAAAGFLNFSQMGMLAVGLGNVVEVYKDCCLHASSAPYMRHQTTTTVSDVHFCPYEDVLGVGCRSGFNSLIIPGSGQPNFDSYQVNPFMTKSQRREMEVKYLLEKIQPELITLNPSHLGSINVPSLKEKLEQKKSVLYVKPQKVEFEPRPKAKGRSKSAKVFKRKMIVQQAAKRELIKTAVQEKSLEKKKSSNLGVLERFKSRSK